MEPEFWHAKWKRNEIGFHETDINPFLKKYWNRICGHNRRVFVPLCGKSLDLLWLEGEAELVTGCELSELAVRQFFEEASREPEIRTCGAARVYHSGSITIWCGDFFELDPQSVGAFDSVYDRGSTVALPAGMRGDYAARLLEFMTGGAQSLLITMEYDQSEMTGPPFSVDRQELGRLFGQDCEISLLECNRQALADNPKFRERGLDALSECAYRLVKQTRATGN